MEKSGDKLVGSHVKVISSANGTVSRKDGKAKINVYFHLKGKFLYIEESLLQKKG